MTQRAASKPAKAQKVAAPPRPLWTWVNPTSDADRVRARAEGQELQAALGLAGRGNFRALHLDPAVGAGLIEMTIPDKPNSRMQKYRISAAGKIYLATKKEIR